MNILLVCRPLFVSFLFLSALTGLVYPLVVTGLGEILFPFQANGSQVIKEGKAIGSTLIGQNWTKDIYFWSRPSATSPEPYFPGSSSGSNLAPSNPILMERITLDNLKYSGGSTVHIPVDLVTTSASGLDPHISLESALFQVKRVAGARGLKEDELRDLIGTLAEGGFPEKFSPKRINLLRLNIALDERQSTK